MPKAPPLVLRAGATARARLLEGGFDADAISTLVGASGGPKWLALRAMDDVWIDRLVHPRTRPLATLGSSIGSFRHACLALPDPKAAVERLWQAYVHQRFDPGRPPIEQVTPQSMRVVDALLGATGAAAVAANERIRSHFVAARLRGGSADRGPWFAARIGASAVANAASRRTLGAFYERAVFGPEKPDVAWPDFRTRDVRLRPENVRPALVASGSIPFLMRGVREIPGAPGTYFDGGIVDYHFDFRFAAPDGLVLFPHFFDRITPGWFDKPWKRRRPARDDVDRVLMVAPSDEFVRSLPGAKVPDRTDFERLPNDDRIALWHDVTERCRVLAEDLADVIDRGTWAERLQPFD